MSKCIILLIAFICVIFLLRLTKTIMGGFLFSEYVGHYHGTNPTPTIPALTVSCNTYLPIIIHMAKHLAKKFATITNVNVVVLGGVENNQSIKFIEKYTEICPSRSMIQKEDIIHPYLYFVNAPSKNFTGSVLVLDGGWTI